MATPIESALRRAAADLDALKVRWALIGGLAISVRSVPRFTKDLDFAVAVAELADRHADQATLLPAGGVGKSPCGGRVLR